MTLAMIAALIAALLQPVPAETAPWDCITDTECEALHGPPEPDEGMPDWSNLPPAQPDVSI